MTWLRELLDGQMWRSLLRDVWTLIKRRPLVFTLPGVLWLRFFLTDEERKQFINKVLSEDT